MYNTVNIIKTALGYVNVVIRVNPKISHYKGNLSSMFFNLKVKNVPLNLLWS